MAPPAPQLHLTVEGLEQVALAGREVVAACGKTTLAPAQLDEIELGLVEALTNVFEHGFGMNAAASAEVTVTVLDDVVRIELTDQGVPLDPKLLQDAAMEFDPDDLDSLPESGMGLHLIRSTFDHVDYESAGGRNRMRLEKRIGG